MELTALGRRVLPYAQAATEAIDQMVSEVDRVQADEAHVLRIGVGRGTGVYLFPRVADIVGGRMPGTSFELSVVPGADMKRALDENRIDILVTTSMDAMLKRAGRPGDEYVAVPLLRYEWSFMASPELAEAVDQNRQSEIRVLLPEWAGGQVQSAESLLAGSPMRTQVTVAVHTEAAKSAALASNALAFIPRYTARHELISGDLVTCLLNVPRHFTVLHVGHRRPARHVDTHDLIVQLRAARELLRELVTVPHVPRLHSIPALASPLS
jgi:DNA-binding transcriptional LysR family regulator